MITPLPCPRCGNEPEVSGNPYTTISCGNCYGYCTESGHDSEIGAGLTRDKAIENWNEVVGDYLDTEAHEIAAGLHPIERKILTGEIDEWGAAVGQALESLQGSGLVHRKVSILGPGTTDLGERVASILRDRQNANAPQVGLGGVHGAGSQADATCDRRHTEDSRVTNVREKKPVDNSDAK